MSDSSPSPVFPWYRNPRRWALVAVAALLVLLLILLRDRLSVGPLVSYAQRLQQYRQDDPLLVYLLAFAVYTGMTGASLPGAVVLTVLYGWLFGFLPAVLLVSFAATTGASIAFLISRYLLRDAVEGKFGTRLARFNAALERDGIWYLFTLRLVPVAPFFIINIVAGLTPLRLRTFWWVSQLGMLPGTCVYVSAGAALPNLEQVREHGVAGLVSWKVLLALTMLGLFPLAARGIARRLSRARKATLGGSGS